MFASLSAGIEAWTLCAEAHRCTRRADAPFARMLDRLDETGCLQLRLFEQRRKVVDFGNRHIACAQELDPFAGRAHRDDLGDGAVSAVEVAPAAFRIGESIR